MMRELEIAEMAAHLYRLSNWNKYFDPDPEHGIKEEKVDLVWAEVELGIMTHLARILSATIDPKTASLVDSTVAKAGEVCAVCQDEMRVGSVSRGLGCSHTFHQRCIERWVKSHNSCPICRHSVEIQDFGFPTSPCD